MKRVNWLVATISLLLGGCFDFSVDSKVGPNGAVSGDAEVAVSAQFAGMIAGLSKDGSNGELLKDCGKNNAQDSVPGVRLTPAVKGTRGDMITCSVHFEIDDPVKVAKEIRSRPGSPDDVVDTQVSIERLNDRTYRVSYTFAPKKPATTEEEKNNPFIAMMTAAMVNHYISVSISAQRIENTTGEVSADGKRVTWKIPVLMLITPPPGYKQELRADIVYGEDSWLDKVKRFFDLEEASRPPVAPPPARDNSAEYKQQLAARIRTSEDQLAQVRSELAKAKEQVDAETRVQAEQQAMLDSIVLKNPGFEIRSGSYKDEPIISFLLENKGSVALKTIYLEGTLQTPGRSVPWVKDSFNHEIRGGVEPGETRNFQLAPNMFSEWGKVSREVVDGAKLTLKLTAFENPAGERIGQDSSRDRTRKEAEDRFRSLEQKVRSAEQKIDELRLQLPK